MNNICLKTENPNKYLSVYLLDKDWIATLTDKGLRLLNNTTNQLYDVLDITTDNAEVFLTEENSPLNWAPRMYYYYPKTDLWEFIPPIEEPVMAISE